jgi:holo-[acyl-carrier protein] synthase
MIIGIGCDVVELSRFERAVSRSGARFLARLFTPNEIAYCQSFSNPLPHFAGRFAAKEALSKALGVGIGKNLSWQEMEIRNDVRGRPSVVWGNNVQSRFGLFHTHISISHSDNVAIAYAVLEKDPL